MSILSRDSQKAAAPSAIDEADGLRTEAQRLAEKTRTAEAELSALQTQRAGIVTALAALESADAIDGLIEQRDQIDTKIIRLSERLNGLRGAQANVGKRIESINRRHEADQLAASSAKAVDEFQAHFGILRGLLVQASSEASTLAKLDKELNDMAGHAANLRGIGAGVNLGIPADILALPRNVMIGQVSSDWAISGELLNAITQDK